MCWQLYGLASAWVAPVHVGVQARSVCSPHVRLFWEPTFLTHFCRVTAPSVPDTLTLHTCRLPSFLQDRLELSVPSFGSEAELGSALDLSALLSSERILVGGTPSKAVSAASSFLSGKASQAFLVNFLLLDRSIPKSPGKPRRCLRPGGYGRLCSPLRSFPEHCVWDGDLCGQSSSWTPTAHNWPGGK